ncbi:MAG: efflux RND transporter permease subunit [Proteobacteria bacterium]|nr:efflux RND transporter permease subunit [Pseudomonadota bacterium]
MNLVEYSIKKPVTVIVGVILLVLFGAIGLFSMPYQLSPTVTEPEITVTTLWPGATPYEIERDIIEPQEQVLKGIPGLVQMESSSFNNQGSITLRFKVGTALDGALLRVSNKVNEVPDYPENVEKPYINASGSDASPVIWMIFRAQADNPTPIATYRTFFEDEIRQHIERVDGVSDLFISGGTEKEMHIVVDPEKLAAYGITMTQIMEVLRSENVNISAGTMGLGRRNYRIRMVSELKSPDEIGTIILKSTGQRRVSLSDVALIGFGYETPSVAMMHNMTEGIAVGVKPEPGVNILELTESVEAVIDEVNSVQLAGKGVYIDWVYDQRPYINGAIDLVRQNIIIGGILAIIVLLLFLRSAASTLVVAVAIPISIFGTFIVMNGLGRNLNVVSLAGISFAVGMLVDNAIVVLENIDRHRRMDKSPFRAAYDGTTEVWGAIFASTVTTVAVFLPVVFIKDEAGQLFQDIAIAITVSVILSLIVSVTVIPMLSKLLFSLGLKGRGSGVKSSEEAVNNENAKPLELFGRRVVESYMGLLGTVLKTKTHRIVTVAVLVLFAVGSTWLLMPKMEYLPQGNRNLVINILIPPPGLSYDERRGIGEHIFKAAEPHIHADHKGLPPIENMFYVGGERMMLFGATSEDMSRAKEYIPFFTNIIYSIPGMFGISMQAGIFQSGLGRGRTIDVDISGGDLNQIVSVAGTMFGMLKQSMPTAQIRPIPSLELLYPEVRLLPERDRLKAAGMSSRDLGIFLDVLMDGRKIGDFKEEGKKKIDLILKTSRTDIKTPEDLHNAPVVTPRSNIVPASSLSTLVRTTGITQIRHLERQRTVTLEITPPEYLALQTAMESIRDEVIPGVKATGVASGVNIELSGAAGKLTETRRALQWNFLLAAVIVYLLMSAMFANFIYPIIILFTVPLAAAGGFIGLKLVNLLLTPQPLDILTMLGFVILIGVVVNNAILIIHQALNNIRHKGMAHAEAVRESTRSRLRPIYMSAFTSIFGMLPLVVAPGPGSELYRGLGSVVLGGLAVSTIFTVFIIPALLLFVIKREEVGRDKEAE